MWVQCFAIKRCTFFGYAMVWRHCALMGARHSGVAEKTDAGRVAPISACVFYSVWCLRLEVAFSGSDTFTILQKLYLPSILHLTLTRCNLLIVNTLLSVRCYKFHLHATYTTYMLPHGTSTGGRYYSIGEQKSLLLRQISLRPYGV